MPLPVLTAEEQRVLGCLLEKQKTVPGSYPLTLNSLRVACNQSSSRDPVVDYSEKTVQDTVRALKDRELVRYVWAGAGSRVVKYHQLLEEALGLADDERALLTVLLLRGPQAPGELRTRTERLYSFADRAAVELCLAGLAAREEPLVRELPLQAGRQDRRWVHLLGPVPAAEPANATAPQLEDVLRDGPAERDARVVAAYDAIAESYSDATRDELERRPFDVWFLEGVVGLADGPVMDLGCGPGHVAGYLSEMGLEVHGLDASHGMVEQARANYPDLRFEVGKFRQLLRPPTASAWGAIVSWFAFGHLAPSELAPTLRTLAGTLSPGGVLALAVQVGGDILRPAELFGVDVDLEFVLHNRDSVLASCAAAGLTVDEWYVRSSLPGEVSADRLYVIARAGA